MRFRVPGIGFYETGGILDWGGGSGLRSSMSGSFRRVAAMGRDTGRL